MDFVLLKRIAIVFLTFFGSAALANNLAGDNLKSAGSGGKHLDIYDTGNNRQCFDINYNKGYADFLNDPFKANNNRGDWGKCIPELLFQTQCVHEYPHGYYDTWQPGEGPEHDDIAEDMFTYLRTLHNNYCLHIDVQFTPLMQQLLNDFFYARNQYALPVSNTSSYDVTVNNGIYYLNGMKKPILTLSAGSTYSFYMTPATFNAFPFAIGSAVGSPLSTSQVTQGSELQLIKITLTIPFSSLNTLVYYSTNSAAAGSKIIVNSVPNAFTVVPKNGFYYLNGVQQPTLTLFRGGAYKFQLTNADQTNFPFSIGLTTTTPFSGLSVSVGSYYTTFTLTLTNSTKVNSLVYYSTINTLMSAPINVATFVPGLPLNNSAIIGNPRVALQMGLYNTIKNLQSSLPAALTSQPYSLSKTCTIMARKYMTNQVMAPVIQAPLKYCSQEPINGVDSCTVNAYLGWYLPSARTSKADCESFQDLTCAAANVSISWMFNGYCQKRRPWSCTEPAPYDDKLICSCVPKAAWAAAQSQPSGSGASSKSISSLSEPAASPSPKVRLLMRTPLSPTAIPTFSPSFTPTVPPTKSPVTINSVNKYISTACLKLMTPMDKRGVYFPLSSQDLSADTCTAVVRMNWNTLANRTCSGFCQQHGLTCVNAFDNYGANTGSQRSCNYSQPIYNDAACQCAEPIIPSVVTVNPDLNTQTCQQMAFYGWLQDSFTYPRQFCPNNLIYSSAADSCTVQIDVWPRISCGTYCSQYPGLKCLYGTYGADDGTCSIHPYGYAGCDVIVDRRMLCTCGVNAPAMAVFTAKKNESLSNACTNMMMTPQPYYSLRQVCSSDLTNNMCTVLNTNSISCNAYCQSFPGMTCNQAFASGVDQWNTYYGCRASPITAANPQPTCDTVRGSLLCQCGFIPGQSNALQLTPLFSTNLPYCPAYPVNLNITRQRRLDDGSDSYYYKRQYKKLTLQIDYDTVKSDGSPKITGLNTSWDFDDWTTDSYRTGTPEMCTGVVSLIRPGDPPSKCSFGNRPGNSASNNCYGKLYYMSFDEASQKCAARGGRLATIDTYQKFQNMLSLFKNDQVLSIGLYDIGGRNWRWDGSSNVPVPLTWFNSTIPFVRNSWSDNCVRINFRPGNNRAPYLDTTECKNKNTFLCEGIPNPATPNVGGDLLADEGGFCIWYYNNPTRSLPIDQSGNFQNTELAHFLLYEQTKSTNKYTKLYDTLYTINGIQGHAENKPNWDNLTRRKIGLNNDNRVFPQEAHNYTYHCHFSPTNFGVSRIYSQQHMLQRLYTGPAYKHCFCGYKNLGYLVDRCDCTRSGEQDNQCLTEQKTLLYTETYAQTGEYVSCNNCNNPSP